MAIKASFTDLEINRSKTGFYAGHSVEIALISKAIMIGLDIWALIRPANANNALGSLNWRLLKDFIQFYIVIVGLFFFLMVVAILPQTGKRVMGRPG